MTLSRDLISVSSSKLSFHLLAGSPFHHPSICIPNLSIIILLLFACIFFFQGKPTEKQREKKQRLSLVINRRVQATSTKLSKAGLSQDIPLSTGRSIPCSLLHRPSVLQVLRAVCARPENQLIASVFETRARQPANPEPLHYELNAENLILLLKIIIPVHAMAVTIPTCSVSNRYPTMCLPGNVRKRTNCNDAIAHGAWAS
ncbi:hypothetical protein BDV12DRAFT_141353 [Aspergillus spectabilis]